MTDFAYLIPAFPLLGFLLLLALGKRLGNPLAGWVATAAVGASFLATVITWLGLLTHIAELRSETKQIFEWMQVGALQVNVALLIDPLSLTMALFVSGVSCLIHAYSVGYMKNDPRFHQFFIYLNLFVFSMLMLVLADNFVLMFLGWEGVGVCSYFLVGFWFERNSAATAAKKAFIVNRIGDTGMLLGIFLIYSVFGTLTYAGAAGVLAGVGSLPEVTVTAIALLLFVGAVGKSAQLPLFVWLPDAMEGPTPVSALIHAATMVTAGVYLMARVAPMLEASVDAALVVAIVGVASALFAATVACAQNDIKRVLAYSTMSQLGFMFAAVGSGAYSAGVFHMITHAFFKALLFLSAGAVIHALHEAQDLKKMGNLRKYLPITFGVFLIGWLSISGVPPFSGFWSKDEILLSLWEYNKVLWGIALFTALLTAYYMSRLFFLAFYGKDRWKETSHKGAKPHEAPRSMYVPMIVLAVLSAFGGLLNVGFSPFVHTLDHFLDPVFGPYISAVKPAEGDIKWEMAIASIAVSLCGIGIAWISAKISSPSPWPAKLEPKLLAKAWFIDPLYSLIFEKPGVWLSRWLAFFFDNKVIDGVVNGTARLIGVTGSGFRRMQNGYVRSYALSIACGTTLILIWAVVRSV